LDETSFVLNHDGQKGVVTKSLERDIVLVKKYRKRGSLTWVAMVSDDSSLQPVLPQVIVGKHNILRVAYLKKLEPMLSEKHHRSAS